jgi:hypothetical protein
LRPKRSWSNSSNDTVSSTIRAALMANGFAFLRNEAADRPVPRWSE